MAPFVRKNKYVGVPWNKIDELAKKAKKAIYKKRRTGLGKKAVIQIVKNQISRNIENKNTATISYKGAIAVGTGSAFNWYLMNNFHTLTSGGNGIFNITRGTQDNHRIGSMIKLKRWVIKGHISPQWAGNINDENTFLFNSYQGYVDVYFGKMYDGTNVDKSLPNFLNNGAQSEAPLGSDTQIFHSVNKYKYKVYYHKRFKVGTSAGTLGANPSYNMIANNDLKLTRTFGFDVCKFILKNRHIRYDDQIDVPIDVNIKNLAVWARFTPCSGSLGIISNSGKQSYYTLMCETYAEYEDA